MLGKQCRINRPHALLGGVAKKDRIQASAHNYSNGCLRFRSVNTRSVVAPIGGRAIGIDEGKLEEAITDKSFAIDGYLTRVIEDRGYCIGIN